MGQNGRGGLMALATLIAATTNSGTAAAQQSGPAAASPAMCACKDYSPTPNLFPADVGVREFLGSHPSAAACSTLPVPCTENASLKAVASAQQGSLSETRLNFLFNDGRTALERLQNGFDLYSWLTFLALNSPAPQAGVFGSHAARTVWESTFTPLDEVMVLQSGSTDAAQNPNRHHLPKSCPVAAPGVSAPALFVSVDDVALISLKTGPLVDQNGNYSLNTIFVNSVMKEYIEGTDSAANSANHPLATYQGQQTFNKTIDFPPGRAEDTKNHVAATLGAMMIKASWRVLTASDDPREFHTVLAYRFFPDSGQCDIKTLGLVGFHVVHKTEHRRQWIWTTFEHVRNVPSLSDLRRDPLPQKSYFFYQPERCTANQGQCDFGVSRNEPPPHPWRSDQPSSRKSQIVRVQDIADDTRTINSEAQKLLGTDNVWSHYQLISTQWPADFGCASGEPNRQADATCQPAPSFLPNSTLETYIQHDIGAPGGVPQATSSCIGCHNNAVSYQSLEFGDHLAPPPFDTKAPPVGCTGDLACTTASDFTFIFEQVCGPMVNVKTGAVQSGRCMREPDPQPGASRARKTQPGD